MGDEERWQYEQHQKQLHHEASLYQSTYLLGEIKGIEKSAKAMIKKGLISH